jgi:hypothetical protein
MDGYLTKEDTMPTVKKQRKPAKLKFFESSEEVLAYVMREIVATLTDDLDEMKHNGEPADELRMLRHKIHDIKLIEPRLQVDTTDRREFQVRLQSDEFGEEVFNYRTLDGAQKGLRNLLVSIDSMSDGIERHLELVEVLECHEVRTFNKSEEAL